MAEKRTIDINIKNNADEATKDFNTFNDALDQTAKSAKNVNSTFEEVYGELQPLTTRLGEAEDRLYELALAGDTTSKEYQELLNKVAEYRKVQIKTDEVVDGAAQTMTQKLGSALNGVTSGFAATQGAMALFGSENEALEKSLLKVQGALAIQQGVQGLTTAYRELTISTTIASAAQSAFAFVTGGATTALKVLRVALITTGIGALIAGVALLVANFEKVKKAIEPAIQGLKDFADWIGITSFAEDEAEKARKARQEAQIAREEKLIELQLARAKQERQNAEAARDANISLEQLLEKQGKGEEARLRKRERLNKELNEAIFNFDSETQDKIRIGLIELDEEEAQILKDKQQRYRDYRDLRLQIARQIEDLENELLQEGIEKELEINRDKFRRLREDAEKNTKLTLEERRRLNDLYTEQEAQKEAEIRNKFFQEGLQQEIELFENNKLPVLQAQADKEVEVEITKWSLIGQAQQAAFEKERMLRKANQEFALQTTSDTLNVISDITNLFAGKNEKAAKKAFQIQKAVSIAQATIDTYKSANAVFASTAANPISIANPSAPFIAAGVAVAAGLVNVATIASQKFQGGGGGGGGAQASAPDLGGGEVAPQFNVVGASGVNQLAQLQQTPTKAFVVSGDVTSAQALDRNRVQNATL
jgi:hypothetical protein